MKVVVVMQARMGSSRLPAKVLSDLAGEPMLARVIDRTRRAKTVHDVVVATTTESRDDAIVTMCKERGWSCFRGSEDDVLSRYVGAAREFGATHVVRITSDCPLTDPALIDEHVRRLTAPGAESDFVSNMVKATFPLGLAVEALHLDVLTRLDRLSPTARVREHVTQLIYDRPDLFLIDHVTLDEDLTGVRLTVDTAEDLAVVRKVFEHFGNDTFTWRDALAAVRAHPEWLELNRHVKQKVV